MTFEIGAGGARRFVEREQRAFVERQPHAAQGRAVCTIGGEFGQVGHSGLIKQKARERAFL